MKFKWAAEMHEPLGVKLTCQCADRWVLLPWITDNFPPT